MSSNEMRSYLLIAVAVGIALLLWILWIVLCREWIKTDLHEKGLSPMRVRWRPWASSSTWCHFEVHYLDADQRLHRAQVATTWHQKNVVWDSDEDIDDQIIDQL